MLALGLVAALGVPLEARETRSATARHVESLVGADTSGAFLELSAAREKTHAAQPPHQHVLSAAKHKMRRGPALPQQRWRHRSPSHLHALSVCARAP